MNLPDYNFLSVPYWLLMILHILTLSLHLAAMNFVFGGIVVVLAGKISDRWNNAAVNRYLGLLPSAMAATITLGVAPLLFIQLVFPKQIYSASIVDGWFWLMIVTVATIIYYLIYAAVSTKNTGRKLLLLALTLVGMLYISFVYSSTFALAENPDLIRMLYAGAQGGLIINPDVGSYIFRWLHVMLGAVTVGAFFVGWLGKDNDEVWQAGKTFYLWGMVAAMVLGFVYLVTFDKLILPFMRSPGIWWLTASIVLSLGSMHFYFKKKFAGSGAMLLVSLIGMVTVRHYARLVHLADYYNPADMPVEPQWGIFAVFAVCSILMLFTVWYMMRLFFRKSSA